MNRRNVLLICSSMVAIFVIYFLIFNSRIEVSETSKNKLIDSQGIIAFDSTKIVQVDNDSNQSTYDSTQWAKISSSNNTKLIDSDIINVKEFGAKGNGIADDTQAIQNILNKVNLSGKTIFFPSGKYKFSNKILIKNSNLKLLGEEGTKLEFSTNGCIPDKRGFVYCDLGIHISKSLNNVSIEKLYIKSNTNDKIVSYGITVLDFSNNIKIRYCELDGFTGGILFNRKNDKLFCSNNNFKNMTFVPNVKAGGYGIVFQGSTNTETNNNNFESSIYRHAIYYARNQFYPNEVGSNHLFQNNVVNGSEQNKYSTGYELSFKILGNSNVIVRNNFFIGGVGHIWIVENGTGGSRKPKDIVIENNQFKNIKNNKQSKVYAIGVDGNSFLDNVTISNNKFFNNSVDDLIKLQRGNNIKILNNNVDGLLEGHFININYGISNLEIKDNVVNSMNPEYDGIYLGSEDKEAKFSTSGIIEGNKIQTALFSIYSNNFKSGIISKNDFSSNNTSIFFAQDVFIGEIKDNKFNKGKYGIFNAKRNRVESFENNSFNSKKM